MTAIIRKSKVVVAEWMVGLTILLNCSTPPPVQANPMTVLCVSIVLGAGYATYTVIIKSCRPTWRCYMDPDNPGTNWCSTMLRQTAEKSGLVGPGINFKNEKACLWYCNTNPPPTLKFNNQGVLEGLVEPVTIYTEPSGFVLIEVVQRSTNMEVWEDVGVLEMNYNGEWEYREEVSNLAPQMFWRVVGRLYPVTNVKV